MTATDWARETVDRIREEGLTGIKKSAYDLYVGGLRRVNRVYPQGTNVYDSDWDLLIILDACRVDLLQEVQEEYHFLDRPGTLTSVGSSSLEWLERTFEPSRAAEMAATAYVTGNPFSYRVLESSNLLVFDEVWKYAWDDDTGTIPARALTDRAIATAREHDPDRLIVHYMQPHFPSVPDPLSDGMNAETLGQGVGWESPWKKLRRGELDDEVVWESYRSNLRYVLNDVSILLKNIDAENVVITADHGNAAGEYGVYGHPRVPLSCIREVPWYRTTATDAGTYTPTIEPEEDTADVEERLSALGYK
jgi:hypothetical protein